MKTSRALVRAAIGVILPIAAFAQSGPPHARPDPLDSQATVPPLHYESALGGYRSMDEKASPATEWRSANDTVRDTGGMSRMTMGGEASGMANANEAPTEHGDHSGMKDMGRNMKNPQSESFRPAKPMAPSPQDSTPGTGTPSGDRSRHSTEKP